MDLASVRTCQIISLVDPSLTMYEHPLLLLFIASTFVRMAACLLTCYSIMRSN